MSAAISERVPVSAPLIRCQGVSLGYPGGPEILRGVDLDVRAGDFLAILGPNGCGKTTLLRAILGLLPPRAGMITWFGGTRGVEYSTALAVRPGYVPQRHALSDLFPFSTFEVVLMGRFGRLGPFARPDDEDREKALASLRDVGLEEKADASFRDLSGGQKQRALLARALCSDPHLLVLDEPTNDLDLSGESSVMGLVSEMRRAGRCSVVFVSHLMHVVASYAERVAVVRDGGLEIGSVDAMFTEERLRALYGADITVLELPDGRRLVAPSRPAAAGGVAPIGEAAP